MVWGGWDGHEPRKCVDLFAPFLEANGFKVQISNSLESYLEKQTMLDLDLIVHCWTEGKILRGQLLSLIHILLRWWTSGDEGIRRRWKNQFKTV